MDTIVFYHDHQNGDCYTSRAFVNHVIKHTNKKYKYYYTARSSLISHCKDIGIPDENFNVIEVPPSNDTVFYKCQSVFINLWISNVPCDFCLWCLTNVHELYNKILIPKLNKILCACIPLMDTKESIYLPFDFSFYKTSQITEYVNKSKYSKICCIFNVNIKTYIFCNYLNYDVIIEDLSKNNTNTLFITFCKTNLTNDNVVAFTDIFPDLPEHGYGIEYAYLCSLVNKVVCVPSGVSQKAWIFDTPQPENKFCIIYYITPDELVPIRARNICDESSHILCGNRLATSIFKIGLNDDIVNSIDRFINI